MTMLLALFPLGLTLSPLAAPQGPAAVSEQVSLEALRRPAEERAPPPWNTLLERTPHTIDLLGGRIEGPDPAAIVELVREWHGPAFEGGQLHAYPLGHSLWLLGDAGEATKAKERVQKALGVLARPVQVEFAVWDAADRETPAAVLAPADFARFFANLRPLSRRVATGTAGELLALEQMRWTRYVRDIAGEVAQKQSATQPLTAQFGEGAHANVRAFALHGVDEFAVHVQFAVAERRSALRTVQTGLPGAADIELPTLETDFGACSGRVVNGGALAITLRGNAGGGGHRILTVRVSSRAAPAAGVHDGFGVFPVGALVSSGLNRVADDGADEEIAGACQLLSGDLQQVLLTHLGTDGEQAGLHVVGGFLYARGSGNVLGRIDGLVRGLQDRMVRGAVLRHVATLEGSDGAASVPLLHELVAPTLFGRQLTLVRQLETNAVTGVELAVAQEAATLDPLVEALRSGCRVSARLHAQDDGGVFARLAILDHFAVAPQARSIMPGGVLMATEEARTRAAHAGSAANGQPIEHGDGPTVTIDGRVYRSALATTIRW